MHEPQARPQAPQRMPQLPLTRSLRSSLLTLLWAGVVVAFIECALLLDANEGPLPFIFPIVFTLYLCGGVLAWWLRPANRTGLLLIAGAGAIVVAGLGNTEVLVFQFVGIACSTLPIAIIVHLMLAYPRGVVHGRFARLVTAGVYVLCTVMQLPLALWGVAPFADRPGAASVVQATQTTQLWVGIALLVSIAALLIGWVVQAPPARRRVLAPVYLFSLAMLLFVPTARVLLEPLVGAEIRGVSQLVALGLIPIVFVMSVLGGGYRRTAEIEELAEWIGNQPPGLGRLQAAVARALGDPSTTLALWRPVRDGFVDIDEREVLLPTDAPTDRASVVVEYGGQVAGAILYDPVLRADASAVRHVGRVVAVALENERLRLELEITQRELRRSPITPVRGIRSANVEL